MPSRTDETTGKKSEGTTFLAQSLSVCSNTLNKY